MIELDMSWTAWVCAAFLALHGALWIELRIGFGKARSWYGPVREVVERTFWEAFEDEWPSLSVIVAARNEEEHLPRLLAALERQRYSKFEVIVVDDGSTDQTATVVEKLSSLDYRFRLVRQAPSGKKAAVSAGIAAAVNPVCVFTDADCIPGPGWLSAHARAHQGMPSAVVVGYSPLVGSASLLVAYQQFDTSLSQFLSAAAIGHGQAYLAKGGNLSYSRDLHDEVGGFGGHGHHLSGDDTLFVQAVRRETTARIRWLDTESVTVPSPARESFRAWTRQKRRQTSTGRTFDRIAMWRAGLFHWTLVLSVLFAIASGWTVLLGLWLILAGVFAIGLGPLSSAFRNPFPRWLLPVFVPLFMVFILTVPVVGMLFPPASWQSRS